MQLHLQRGSRLKVLFTCSALMKVHNLHLRTKNVSTIRELSPISSHLTSTFNLRIYKHVHQIVRTRTRECRVTKNSIQNGVIGSREMWRRSFLTFPCPCYPCLILLGAEGAGGGGGWRRGWRGSRESRENCFINQILLTKLNSIFSPLQYVVMMMML